MLEVLDEPVTTIHPAQDCQSPYEVLERAAELIKTHGWCQEVAYRDRSMCALGAIWAAGGWDYTKPTNDQSRHTAILCYKARDHLKVVIKEYDIGSWNDKPERTKEEVITALQCAARLRK